MYIEGVKIKKIAMFFLGILVGINSIKDMNEYKEIMENVNQAKEELKRIDELIAVRSSRIDFLEDKTLRITGNQR
ncbi:TPA: hypothetical protein VVE56_002150 [Streptococcus pneumoniae]|uniref:hypothetical protein n=1 Tax=Streptococcus pneumoniae TaxID=1313 RepID=UPI000447AC4B|nr:hypothetical protein [Streptococcus pneumoniae]KAA02995.1 hypothetical protein SP2UMMC_04655 [Streptococcus pneumoniae DAR3264]QIQ00878.1 hypothetical protein HA248_11120 [Streptococcus pneumoniae]VJR34653.1 Uncharacterised protein [Streptococcus pneumoniae]VKA85867.1 Uncharacterised protein [Streptococcus pneumoniae]VOA32526.1 Uncharacterised protein [Streptococcus pneumoniae]